MKNKGISKGKILSVVAALIILGVPLIVAICILKSNERYYNVPESIKDTERIYECDYHTVSLRTKITFKMDGEDYAITGNLITFFTDPLKLEKNGKTVGYASDKYHFIGQDDHVIVVDGKQEISINGNFELIGNSYELYNASGTKAGYAEFGAFCTAGAIYDSKGTIVATYSSPLLFNDYTVKIYDNDICSDKAMLMIIASYVSDYKADQRTSNNSHHNND